MKTIKIIDLLNMIFNKELPDGSKVRIKCAYGYYEGTYTYRKNYYWKCSLIDFDIEDKGKNENMFFLAYNYDLSDEVEIIEEEKEIEKLDYKVEQLEKPSHNESLLMNMIRENKETINKLIEELKRDK